MVVKNEFMFASCSEAFAGNEDTHVCLFPFPKNFSRIARKYEISFSFQKSFFSIHYFVSLHSKLKEILPFFQGILQKITTMRIFKTPNLEESFHLIGSHSRLLSSLADFLAFLPGRLALHDLILVQDFKLFVYLSKTYQKYLN